MSAREQLELIGLYPSFSVVSSTVPIRISAGVKRPRVSIGLGTYGESAYITGFINAPDGKEEAIHAFLTEKEDRRMLQSGRRGLKTALVDGEWREHVPGFGFSLRECVVREEEL